MNQWALDVKPDAVVFDFDGLMADSEPLARWAWQQTLARYGRELDDQTFREVQGMRVADSARLFCQRFSLPISPEEAMAQRDALFLEALPDRLSARPGLYPLLDELETRGLPLGIATSGHRRYVTLALHTLGLNSRFRAIATGDEVARGKPAPDIYLLAAERLGVDPQRCLALEDAPLGVQSACAAGMTCVAVPGRWTAALPFHGVHSVFPSLHEVREALDDLLAPGQTGGERPKAPRAPSASRECEDGGAEKDFVCYVAAGGVVVNDGRVLVLRRRSGGEVRLPKGHVEPGEDARTAAARETGEESGYAALAVQADLGTQVSEFVHAGRHVVRTERYFLMTLTDDQAESEGGEEQFEPLWLTWDEALAALTFEPEREWVRRALAFCRDHFA